MVVKVRRRELVELWQLIEHHRKIKHSVKVSYFMAKNRKRIQPEIEALEEAIEPSKDFKQYDTARANLAKYYADKDNNDRPIIHNSSYVITTQLDEFNKELEVLKESHKDTISKREKQLKDYNEFLDEEIEFDGYQINLEDLPKEIEPVFIECLMDMELLIEPNEK